MAAIKSSIINNNYQQILKQDNGAAFVKVDLHVHTPAYLSFLWWIFNSIRERLIISSFKFKRRQYLKK